MHEQQLSIEGILIDKKRKTTTKTRVIAKQQHQVRVDEEDTFPINIEATFLKLVDSLISDIDVIILQDYNKGVLTPDIINSIIKLANKTNIPTIVDPKSQNFNCYKNCTIFKPNLSEIKEGMKMNCNVENIEELEQVTEKLRALLNADAILLTLSEKGICINTKKSFKYTDIFIKKIEDISGAGDTVLAVAGVCLATNINYDSLSILANIAGGIVCENVGVVPINKERLLNEAIKCFNNDKS